MHAKTDSDMTSLGTMSPPRSPRRLLYYVQSPSQHDVDKMSYQSSPTGSPHHYHCSPIHHSRESSTTRFSASLKNPKINPWKKLYEEPIEDDDDEDIEDGLSPRFYVICFVFCFVLLFSVFSLIIWGASLRYKPKVSLKSIVFEGFNIQAGTDDTGVPTKMLTINSTVKIFYRNPATFFGVHVTSTPVDLYFSNLRVASGNMKAFYLPRKNQRLITTIVHGEQIPLYGGGSNLGDGGVSEPSSVNLKLRFVMRSRAYVLGKLVKPKFYRKFECDVLFRHIKVGKSVGLHNSCSYDD